LFVLWAELLQHDLLAFACTEQISFASTVYRAFKAPTNYTEPCDGSYMGLDGAVHTAAPGAAFLSDLSEWDIARTQASWLALLAPDVSVDLTNTLVAMAVQVGVT
jgi:putative alpha-1,2-mannosidase